LGERNIKTTKLHALAEQGQAIWYDYIRRSLITSGELEALVDEGLRGVTSNPSIFEKAIVGSADYDDDLHRLVEAGKSVEEIYEALVLDDIRGAADILRPVYEQTNGADGYVSLEVSPTLAHDTHRTVTEARRLFSLLARPNAMIKVPATPEGIPAVEMLIGEGINVNVTLLFSVANYAAVAEAYIKGLEKLQPSGGDPSSGSGQASSTVSGQALHRVSSVASFFVSRVDTMVDQALEKIGNRGLQGKIAVANAKIAYAEFKKIFTSEWFAVLAKHGARKQRPLWASTGTKNPLYSDTLYVDNLIGPDTVNTVPPVTLKAFMDHGNIAPTLEADIEEARANLARLAELGIDLGAITEQLQKDGVSAFVKSFETLMASIAEKRERLLSGWKQHSANLGSYQVVAGKALEEMDANKIVARIWDKDHTVWKPEATEITYRLGWLHVAEMMSDNVPQLDALVEGVRAAGYRHALLLGMGGSSLAPEVFRKTFGVKVGYLDLAVLDSTDPGAVLSFSERLDPRRTLYLVSTKSGGTVETFSFFRYFYNQVLDEVGAEEAGRHFAAITDAGSKLAQVAEQYHFRATFLNDPNIGGRYSALSYFGLVPAALVGVDVSLLLDRALRAACAGESCVSVNDNVGAWLGVIMGALAKARRDKVTFVISPAIASFGDWVEQLIAESTGKEGRGILPVVGELLAEPTAYADDRLFVQIKMDGEGTHDHALAALEAAGHPVVRLQLHSPYDLGGQFFVWEFATAVAGSRIGINAFDQPNVETAKALARQMVYAYQKEGRLPEPAPSLRSDGLRVYADLSGLAAPTGLGTPGEALKAFLAQADPGNGKSRSYVALQAYVQPDPRTTAALQALRTCIQTRQRLATTVGYGPRFLHSTGQLHKGDGGSGLFIQFTADMPRDAAIPDEGGSSASSMTFSVLKSAQVLGDAQALRNAGRRVIRFHLGKDVVTALNQLAEALK
jgi:transaldolase / glucose-6-phosphate isomerase